MAKAQRKYSAVKDRHALLEQCRNLKMARSAHAYVRGNVFKFYEWLGTSNGLAVPQGPPVWICGDCHVGNLGPIANAEGEIAIQIRDVDQTVIGNPAHDLIRLGLSLAMSVRGSDLPGVTTAQMLEHMMAGYEKTIHSPRTIRSHINRPESVRIAMKHSLRRKWKQLAKERIDGSGSVLPLGKHFWPLSDDEKQEIKELFQKKETQKLATLLRSREDKAEVQVLDAAYWLKGCSSLGRLRYAVLLRIKGENDEFCLMDLKEAVAAAAPRDIKSSMPSNNGKRIVEGARHLAPYLGERMLASRLRNKAIFLRELLPQDMKIQIERVTRDEIMNIARFFATVVGKSHAQQMDSQTRRQWYKELNQNHSKTLDAPSWLWSSVVELIVSHEAAYLEHCRKYALNA